VGLLVLLLAVSWQRGRFGRARPATQQ